MEHLNERQRYLKALRREPVDRVPAPAFCSHPLVELMKASQTYAPDIHYDLGAMVNFALEARNMLGFEGVRLPTDGTFEAEAFGCRVNPGNMERNPFVDDHPFTPDRVVLPEDFLQRGRIPLLLEAVRTVKRKVAREVPVTSHFMGPMTVSSHLVGLELFLKGFYRVPETVGRLLDSVTEKCILMGNALAEAGADVLQMPDPVASSDVIRPGLFSEFLLPRYMKIFQNVACPVVLHICGDTTPLLHLLKGIKAAGFSFDSAVDVAFAGKVLGKDLSLVGNISTTGVLLHGGAEEVWKETTKAIRGGIHVVAPSCGFAPRTPLENVRAMICAAKESIIKKNGKQGMAAKPVLCGPGETHRAAS